MSITIVNDQVSISSLKPVLLQIFSEHGPISAKDIKLSHLRAVDEYDICWVVADLYAAGDLKLAPGSSLAYQNPAHCQFERAEGG